MNYFWETFKIAFYLVLIIAFILAIYYLVKNKFNLNNSRQMEIIDSLRLANGENLYLVKIFDEIVMLGGTKNQLNYLQSWSAAEIDFKIEEEKKEADFKGNFKETFKKFTAKKNKDNDAVSSDQDE